MKQRTSAKRRKPKFRERRFGQARATANYRVFGTHIKSDVHIIDDRSRRTLCYAEVGNLAQRYEDMAAAPVGKKLCRMCCQIQERFERRADGPGNAIVKQTNAIEQNRRLRAS